MFRIDLPPNGPLWKEEITKPCPNCAGLREQLAEYEGLQDQFNWQSEQNAQAIYELEQDNAALEERLAELESVLQSLDTLDYCPFCNSDALDSEASVAHSPDCQYQKYVDSLPSGLVVVKADDLDVINRMVFCSDKVQTKINDSRRLRALKAIFTRSQAGKGNQGK